MTPALMSPIVKLALSRLPREAKAELRAWLANKLQPMVTSNGMEADDHRFTHLIRGYARQRNRASEVMLQEFDEIFKPAPERNGHLGARAEEIKR